jgi:RND family efflux transporter MFP subunit
MYRRVTPIRANKLVSTHAVSQQDIDSLQAELRVNEQDLARSVEQQALLRLELERSSAALDVRTIKSPPQGVVTEKTRSGGEYVNEAGHMVTIATIDPLYVEAFLPAQLYGRISAGETASVETEAPLRGRYEARIAVVDRVIDAGSSTFGVRLTLPNSRGDVPAGLHCKVTFTPKEMSQGKSSGR